jgi:hypothetical protein
MSCVSLRLCMIGVLAAAVAAGCALRAANEPENRKADGSRYLALPVNLAAGPITLFERACARCHGPAGSLYGDEFAGLDDRTLADRVAAMMEGPGGLNPTPAELAGMVAYQKALRDKRPFACILNGTDAKAGRTAVLCGEVTRGASLEIRRNSASLAADVQATNWTVSNPPPPPFDVAARIGSSEARFAFPASQWSDRPR